MSLPNDPPPPSGLPSSSEIGPQTGPVRRNTLPGRGLLIGAVTVLLLAGVWAGATFYSAGQAQQVSDNAARTIDTALKANSLGSVEKHIFTRGLTESTDDIMDDIEEPF